MALVVRGFLSGLLVTRGLASGAAVTSEGLCPDPFSASVSSVKPDPFSASVLPDDCGDPFSASMVLGARLAASGGGGGGPPGGSDTFGLGATMDFANYFAADQMFTDMMVCASRRFEPPYAQVIVCREGYARPGQYVITSQGKGTVRLNERDIPGGFGAYTFTGAGEQYTFDIVHGRGTIESGTYRMRLQVLSYDAADPLRDLQIYPSGYDPDTQIVFPDFLAGVTGCYALRSLHFYNIEGNDRGGIETGWSTAEPWKWVKFFELCNAANSRPWICIPHQATADYCRNLGELAAETLDPGLLPLLEYSNEIWNWAYPYAVQTAWVRDEGMKIGIGDFRKAYAHFAMRCFDPFEQGYGSPCTRVLSGHHVNLYSITASIAYCRANGHRFDAIGGAPYVNPAVMPWAAIEAAWDADDLDEVEALVRDTMIADIAAKHEPLFKQWKALADSEGVELHAYESGQGIIWGPAKDDPDPTARIEFLDQVGKYTQRSEGMGEVVTQLYETMSLYYNGAMQTGYIGDFGVTNGVYAGRKNVQFFGLKEWLDDDDTPKFQAFRSLVERWAT